MGRPWVNFLFAKGERWVVETANMNVRERDVREYGKIGDAGVGTGCGCVLGRDISLLDSWLQRDSGADEEG